MNNTRSSPLDRMLDFLEKRDEILADRPPVTVDWSARARKIAEIAANENVCSAPNDGEVDTFDDTLLLPTGPGNVNPRG
jgi:hypothetical protein